MALRADGEEKKVEVKEEAAVKEEAPKVAPKKAEAVVKEAPAQPVVAELRAAVRFLVGRMSPTEQEGFYVLFPGLKD